MRMTRFGQRQLEYFIAVAEAGSFRQAAEVVHVSQPSLSTQVAAMERALDAPLFHRLARGVSLTRVGRVLLKEARTAVAANDRAYRMAKLAADGENGELKFATITSIASGLVPRTLEHWRAKQPGIHIGMTEFRNPVALEQSIRDGHFDFAIGPEPTDRFTHTQLLGSEEFVILLPRDDVLLAETQLPLQALADRRWVLLSADNGVYRVHQELFAREKLQVAGAAHTSQTDVAVNLAAAGLGPTVVPRNMVPQHLLPLTRSIEPPFLREIFAYSLDTLDSLAARFVRELSLVIDAERTTGDPRPIR